MAGTGPADRPAAVSAPQPDDRRDPWLGPVPDGADVHAQAKRVGVTRDYCS